MTNKLCDLEKLCVKSPKSGTRLYYIKSVPDFGEKTHNPIRV